MRLAYQPPPIPEESLYLELRKAALAGDTAAVERLLAAIEAGAVEGAPAVLGVYEGYLLYMTGHLLRQQGHLDQATRAFQWFVAAKPELASGHLALGECYLAAGKDDLARASLEEGLRLNPWAAWAAIALQGLE
jgi:tetratricopeptide (TPR) repeat protein